jgi:leader peptidase (prepilin peptidase)/N-methyltransferase
MYLFDARIWAQLPFHFWSVMLFILGCMVGSFLNVCIHRMPLDQSIVSPPSHCPHCRYSIPWFLNVPLVTWLYLRGRCRNCGAPISVRYFLVELLTGGVFLATWLRYGQTSVWLALVYSVFLAGLIVATFIDFEHYIIPDEITLGGAVAGFAISFALPLLHGQPAIASSIKQSLLGIAVGAGIVYAILRLGKLMFGRQKLALEGETKMVFSETALVLPDKSIPYEEVFYRRSDVIRVHARTVEMVDRGYKDVLVEVSPEKLRVGDDEFDPEAVPHLEAVGSELVLPREAMGLGDVKFMAGIGAFLGWQAVVFSLMVSSVIGSIVGITAIALGRREWSSRLPYGPYIAVAAAIWVFGGKEAVRRWLTGL